MDERALEVVGDNFEFFGVDNRVFGARDLAADLKTHDRVISEFGA